MPVKILLSKCVAGVILASGAVALRAQSAQPSTGVAAPKTTEQVYKNIQVLKGVPADQLIPAMQFITASLGVECEYCHGPQAMDNDDKKPKKIARRRST